MTYLLAFSTSYLAIILVIILNKNVPESNSDVTYLKKICLLVRKFAKPMENTTLAALVCTRFIIVCRSVKYHTQNNFNSFFVYFQFWKALFWKCKQQRVCNWFGVFGLLLSTLKKAVALLIKLCNYFLYRVSHNRKR